MKNSVKNYRCLPLLATIMAMILTAPLMEGSWSVVLGVVWSGLFGISGYLVFPTRHWLRVYLLLMLAAVVVQALQPLISHPTLGPTLMASVVLAIQSLAFFAVMRHALFAHVRHEFDRVLAAISGYFLLALIWSKVFKFAILASPGAIADKGVALTESDSTTLLYYSLITLTTVGYGDIVPVNDYARLLSSTEGAIGTLYIAVVIASLVGRLIGSASRPDRQAP